MERKPQKIIIIMGSPFINKTIIIKLKIMDNIFSALTMCQVLY